MDGMDSITNLIMGGAGVFVIIYCILILVMLVLTIVAMVAIIKIPKEIEKLSNNVNKLCYIVGQNNKNLGRPENEYQNGYGATSQNSQTYNYPMQ